MVVVVLPSLLCGWWFLLPLLLACTHVTESFPRFVVQHQQQTTTRRQSSRLWLDERRFLERTARQEARIYQLEQQQPLSYAEQGELQGLKEKVEFVEQYDPSTFSPEHVAFKQQHNRVFARLCHCVGSDRNIFFLDGPDAGTASILQQAGLSLDCFHVANRHEATCQALTEWGVRHVTLASAVSALSAGGDFCDTSFGAYYFDGCGGHPPAIMDMLTAALDKCTELKPPIAIGYSIIGGNRDAVNKELCIRRCVVQLAKRQGLVMRHVLEDCERYGIVDETTIVELVEGNTLTAWFVLTKEKDER